MGLLADYLPGLPDDPSQNSAARQGLLAFGAAMLGGKGSNFGQILGQGLASGAGGYNSALQALQQKALVDAQTKHYSLENDTTQAALDQQKAIAAAAAQRNAQVPSAAASLVTNAPPADPSALSSVPQASPAPDAGLPLSMFPQSNAAPVSSLPQIGAAPASPRQPSSPAPAAADPFAAYKKAVDDAQFYATNFPGSKAAENALKVVDALKPKVKELKAVTAADGKTRVLANFFEDASLPPQILQGVNPDLEKLVFGDDGANRIGQNAYTGAIESTVKKSATPGELLQSQDQAKTRAQQDRHWKAEQESKGDDAPTMSQDAKVNAAVRYNLDGTLPPLGIGKQGVGLRSEILNMAANLSRGQDPAELRRSQLAFKGDVASQNAAVKAFTSGKLGNSVRSFNVSISHLDTLGQLSDALDNNDTPAINRIGNFFAKQTGKDAPTNFEAAKHIVADEVVKAIVGSGGALADREEAAKTIAAANSPAQLKGVISTYKELMKGQLDGLQQQYEQSTGRKDFDRFLSGGAKETRTRHDVKPVNGLPQKSGVPADISGLLNKYGAR